MASPLALAPHRLWRVPPGIGHHPQAWEGSARHRAPPTSCGKGGTPVLSTAGGQLPCPLETACVVGPFAGRHACGRVPPGAGHHPQVVHDILPWGARSGLSVTRARCRLLDPSLVASPLALAPHRSWRVPPGIGHHPQAWEGSARHRAPPTSMGGFRPGIGHHPQAWEGSARHRAPPTSCRGGRNTCAVHRGGAAPLSSSIPCRPSLPAPCSLPGDVVSPAPGRSVTPALHLPRTQFQRLRPSTQ